MNTRRILDLAGLTEEWVRDAGIGLQRRACELRSAFDVRTAVRLGTAPEQIVTYAAEQHRAERTLGLDIAPHHGLPLHVHAAVPVGDPYAEIVQYAGEIRAGLIVVGTHSRHTIGRQLLGSVTQKVLRRAPCPILTVQDETVRVERHETTALRASAPMAG
jgi:nucleotide-binding universal stress UspA family protein